MKVIPTDIPDVLILEPKVFGDDRGFFFESYNRRAFREATGLDPDFVQDNHSKSARNVLRGLHYQVRNAQGKLVRVTAGRGLRRGGGPAPLLAHLRQVGGRDALGRQPPHALGAGGVRARLRRDLRVAPSSSTRPPTTTRRSTSARSSGTIPRWGSPGPSQGAPLLKPNDAERHAARRRGDLSLMRILLIGTSGQVGFELAAHARAPGRGARLRLSGARPRRRRRRRRRSAGRSVRRSS